MHQRKGYPSSDGGTGLRHDNDNLIIALRIRT